MGGNISVYGDFPTDRPAAWIDARKYLSSMEKYEWLLLNLKNFHVFTTQKVVDKMGQFFNPYVMSKGQRYHLQDLKTQIELENINGMVFTKSFLADYPTAKRKIYQCVLIEDEMGLILFMYRGGIIDKFGYLCRSNYEEREDDIQKYISHVTQPSSNSNDVWRGFLELL